MELPFPENTFVEIVSSEIFDDCVSQDGEFSHAVFAELIKNEQIERDYARIQCGAVLAEKRGLSFGTDMQRLGIVSDR